MSFRLTRFILGLVGLLSLAGCKKNQEPFEVLRPPQPSATLQRHWQLPDFVLTERDGRRITLAEMRGKVWIADFFYTTCPGPCPMLTSRLSELYSVTRTLAGVALVSISTDPQKDTPDVLQQYAKKFGAAENWLFLTGEKSEVYQLANQGFKLGVTDEGGTEKEPNTHSTKLVLVDKNGTVRGFYDGLSADQTQNILRDTHILLKESR